MKCPVSSDPARDRPPPGFDETAVGCLAASESVYFDEFEDAVVALELVATLSGDVRENPSLWKWMIIGAQNAVQAAMVLVLKGTDGCGALQVSSQQKNREWWLQDSEEDDDQPQQPKVFMDYYEALLCRVKQQQFMEGPPLVVSAEDCKRLKSLNKLRGKFAHFNPKGWRIEIKLLLSIMTATLDTIEHLLTTQDRVRVTFSDNQQERRIGTALKTLRTKLDLIE
jgi:hypothetical protein